MAKAWLYQDDKQVKKVGEEAASWYVGWIDPEGRRKCKSCGPGTQGKRNAEKLRTKREAELIEGTYKTTSKKTWKEFREEYVARIVPGMAPRTAEEIGAALDHFERLEKPGRVSFITTGRIDSFIAKRRKEGGKKQESTISPATVNEDLRQLRAALAVAVEWEYLDKVPKFRMEKVPKKLARFMTGEHFAAIYEKCDVAKRPAGLPYPAADWWRGLLVMAYMTGWRISELLALKREDVDLELGTAVTMAEDNKGDRDEAVMLHPLVVQSLKALPSFGPTFFPWDHNKTTLYNDFADIQEAAKVDLPCRKKHKHTRHCHVYGFHDLRRTFATMNADRLTPDALQKLMRHKSYSTTQIYINVARQVVGAVDALHVPEVLKKKMP